MRTSDLWPEGLTVSAGMPYAGFGVWNVTAQNFVTAWRCARVKDIEIDNTFPQLYDEETAIRAAMFESSGEDDAIGEPCIAVRLWGPRMVRLLTAEDIRNGISRMKIDGHIVRWRRHIGALNSNRPENILIECVVPPMGGPVEIDKDTLWTWQKAIAARNVERLQQYREEEAAHEAWVERVESIEQALIAEDN